MSDWRNDIAIIREVLTGELSTGWRNDLQSIAQAKGLNANGWRDAIQLIAQEQGIMPSGWRNDVSKINQTLTGSEFLPWRLAIEYIKNHIEGKLPAPVDSLFFLNVLPRQINTRYVILANGIIEADKVVMA